MEGIEQREERRMNCYTPIDLGYQGKFRRGFLKNLSFRGAFVEIPEQVDVGENLVMTFVDPFFKKNIKTSGKIVWSDKTGFGVRFVAN